MPTQTSLEQARAKYGRRTCFAASASSAHGAGRLQGGDCAGVGARGLRRFFHLATSNRTQNFNSRRRHQSCPFVDRKAVEQHGSPRWVQGHRMWRAVSAPQASLCATRRQMSREALLADARSSLQPMSSFEQRAALARDRKFSVPTGALVVAHRWLVRSWAHARTLRDLCPAASKLRANR